MTSHLPPWVGWPGTGSPPGGDWQPGFAHRVIVWALLCAFLALALTVDYAYSVTFFLLALVGLYTGLRRGFLSGLMRHERLLMLVFTAYPLIAILSYLLGTQTNEGFRMLGRDLRLLLFIPAYLAIRWARPPARVLSVAALVGVLAAAGIAAYDWMHGASDILSVAGGAPTGVTGTHITFGDMALLLGAVGAGLLLPPRKLVDWLIAWSCVVAGIVVAVLSLARGSWLAIPFVTIIAIIGMAAGAKNRVIFVSACLLVVISSAIVLFSLNPVAGRLHLTFHKGRGDVSKASMVFSWSRCPNGRRFLREYARGVFAPVGHVVPAVKLVKASGLPKSWHSVCRGGFLLRVHAPGNGADQIVLDLPRIGFPDQEQSFHILARGSGQLLLWDPRSVAKFDTVKLKTIWASSKRKSPGTPATLIVPAGRTVEFIPLQEPYAYGGYSLAVGTGSISDRLRMWRFSWGLFLTHPVLGSGFGAFKSLAVQYSLQGNGNAVVARQFSHPHSSYLNALYSGGSVLFLAVILLLSSPLIAARSVVAWLIVSAMSVFAVTESIFVHSFVVSFYVVIVALASLSVHNTVDQGINGKGCKTKSVSVSSFGDVP